MFIVMEACQLQLVERGIVGINILFRDMYFRLPSYYSKVALRTYFKLNH